MRLHTLEDDQEEGTCPICRTFFFKKTFEPQSGGGSWSLDSMIGLEDRCELRLDKRGIYLSRTKTGMQYLSLQRSSASQEGSAIMKAASKKNPYLKGLRILKEFRIVYGWTPSPH